MVATKERLEPLDVTSPPARFKPPRRLRRDPIWRAWMLAWLATPLIGIANGAARNVIAGERTLTVDQLATATLIVELGLYMWWMQGRRPLPSTRTALGIGLLWAVLTEAFEFGFGLGVTGDSFADLIGAYDITAGKVWALVPLWMFAGPALIRRLRT